MRRTTVALALCLWVPAGCSQHASSPLPAPPSDMLRLQPNSSVKALYNFKASPDGSYPAGRLLLSNGTFYGNTTDGGKSGFGTIYKISTTGKESVLHSFAGSPNDGRYPAMVLAFKNGEFYGTTQNGGTGDYGTIFKISASGAEHVLYSFKSNPDGQSPLGGLVELNGSFYGTTQFGGAYGFGSFFKVSTSGTEKVLFSFNVNQSPPDGGNPIGDLLLVNGTFYGTTINGAMGNHGAVFKISPSGVEHTLHTFKGQPDGSNPYSGLIDVNGTLYGTTQNGGANNHGAVFKITPSGAEHVIYSFKGSPDGLFPSSRLVLINGALYGSTMYGGANGLGSIFKVTTAGAEHVIYSFAGPPADGELPVAGMTAASGALYGTTTEGGTGANGMVFKLTP